MFCFVPLPVTKEQATVVTYCGYRVSGVNRHQFGQKKATTGYAELVLLQKKKPSYLPRGSRYEAQFLP